MIGRTLALFRKIIGRLIGFLLVNRYGSISQISIIGRTLFYTL